MTSFLVIEIDDDAYHQIHALVKLLRRDPVKNKHTARLVEYLVIATRHFNKSYFVEATRHLGVPHTKVEAINRATDFGLKIQEKLLYGAFRRFSHDQLVHLANSAELRSPVFEDGRYVLMIPVGDAHIEASHRVISLMRTGADRKQKIDALVDLASESLHAIVEHHFFQPMAEIGANTYLIKLVRWASGIWYAMNNREVRKLGESLDDEQFQRYAQLIEERLRTA